MSPNARRALLAVSALVLAVVALALARPHRIAYAQETDLPGAVADSLVPAAPAAPGAQPTPGAPGAPALPPLPGDLDRADIREIRRSIHAGDNDVVQVGHDVVIEANQHVLGHVIAMGGNVTVLGQVDDDVVAMGGDVTIEDGAQVRGDVVSLGGQVHKSRSATVLGSTVTVGGFPRRFWQPGTFYTVGHGVRFLTAVAGLLFWLLVGWIVVSLFPARSRRVLDSLRAAFGSSFLWGLLGFIAIVPAFIGVVLVAILLCVTIIGIPVGVLLILGYCLAVVALFVWGGVLGASWVGEWTIGRLSPRLGAPTLVRSTLVGLTVAALPGMLGDLFALVGLVVPPALVLGTALRVCGRVFQLVLLLAGIGAVLRARAGQLEPVRMPWSGAGPPTPAPPPAPPASPAPPAAAPPVPPPALPGAPETTA